MSLLTLKLLLSNTKSFVHRTFYVQLFTSLTCTSWNFDTSTHIIHIVEFSMKFIHFWCKHVPHQVSHLNDMYMSKSLRYFLYMISLWTSKITDKHSGLVTCLKRYRTCLDTWSYKSGITTTMVGGTKNMHFCPSVVGGPKLICRTGYGHIHIMLYMSGACLNQVWKCFIHVWIYLESGWICQN